jgi:hypothetical protein
MMSVGLSLIDLPRVQPVANPKADPLAAVRWHFSPETGYYITFSMIDPESGRRVPYGEHVEVVMNHVSKSMFLPNNLERDTAIRDPGPDGQVGDSVSEVRPVEMFDGEAVIEGVY